MKTKSIVAAALCGAVYFAAATTASASLVLFTDSGPSSDVDVDFNNLCGGADNFDCEFTVGEVRIGDRDGRAQNEVILFDRLSGTAAVGAQANSNGDLTGDFSLSYAAGVPEVELVALGQTISFGLDLSETNNGANNPSSEPLSLVLRSRRTNLTDLELVSNEGTDSLPDFTELNVLNSTDVGYLYLGGFDLTQDWTLSGFFELNGAFRGSGSAFQVKVTDLEVPGPAVIPLPAGVFLLAGALGLLGAGRVLRRA